MRRRSTVEGGLLVVLSSFLLTSSGVQADCPGDIDGSGKVTVDELVSTVASAMYGCAGQATSASRFTVLTDRGRYRPGDEMQVTASLSTDSDTIWGSAFPLVGGVVEDCILDVFVTKCPKS